MSNYTVPEIESDKYDIKIDSYNMDNKLLKALQKYI